MIERAQRASDQFQLDIELFLHHNRASLHLESHQMVVAALSQSDRPFQWMGSCWGDSTGCRRPECLRLPTTCGRTPPAPPSSTSPAPPITTAPTTAPPITTTPTHPLLSKHLHATSGETISRGGGAKKASLKSISAFANHTCQNVQPQDSLEFCHSLLFLCC